MDVGLVIAVLVTGVAAVSDCKTGEIGNWVTIPPALGGPVIHAAVLGPRAALSSVTSLTMCAAVPYILFRKGSMGGGDVKLFAAIGALTGANLATGLEIQLLSFLIAAGLAFAVVPWWRGGTQARDALRSPVRLGAPVFLGTVMVAATQILGEIRASE